VATSIDTRVVEARFDNAQFQQGVAATLKSLDSLNKALNLQGATKGLQDIATHGANVAKSTAGVEQGVNSIAARFKAMSVVAVTALATIAHQAVSTGGQMLKSLTVAPLQEGLKEYETNLNSIQTILANTGLEGAKGLKTVTNALDELNHYSDQTIYNFSEMARNIGTFTAAGVTLDVATEAIKGIANLAAVSGSNAQQASTAMYQLSQAISAGRVTLEDWNSVVNAGMGGRLFQESLMETARIHGVAIDKMVKDAGSFRLSLQEGWLTGEILTETLSKFTGDLNAAQLKNMGYNAQQIEQILKMGKTAQDAATKVKTMSQLINTLQESATSGWAQTWSLIFGDFDEAREMFTAANNVLGGFVSANADARNNVLKDWKELGGRTVLIKAISNAFNALISVVRPIRDAFRQIFPATTGQDLLHLTVILKDFTERLIIGASTADKLRRTFAGVFAILGIGWDIVKEGIGLFFRLFGLVGEGSGGFLETTASIGDFLVGIRAALQEGRLLERFFDGLGDVLELPIKALKQIGAFLGSIFDGFDGDKAAEDVSDFAKKLEPLGSLGELIVKIWTKVGQILDNIARKFAPFADMISDFVTNVSGKFADMFGDFTFDNLFAGVNAGLIAAILLAIRNFIAGLGGQGQGFLENINDTFQEFTGTLQSMQNTLRAATLLQIAVAVGILALSMDKLSKIDAAGLTRAGAAMTVMFTQLLAALLIFEKISSFTGFAKMPFVAASMILLAIAVNVLASAVEDLAQLNWNELSKGLTGVTVLIAALTTAMNFMPAGPKMITSAAATVILAAAIKVLASAVTDLSGLSWEELAKGLTGVALLLGALSLYTKFAETNKGGLLSGAGLVLLAVGIKILASAMEDLGNLSWEQIARGLTAMAGGLTLLAAALLVIPPSSIFSAAAILVTAASLGMIADALEQMGGFSWGEIAKGITALAGALTLIAAALTIIPPTAIFSAAGIFIVAASLGMMADALKEMGQFSWGEIGKSLTLLAGALTIIAVGLTAMIAALPGAAALVIVTAALAVLAPILKLFGNMSWGEIGKGLLVLAGVFGIFAAAGLLLTPVVPTLLALGIAINLLGIGMLAAGAGVLLFATGLTLLAAAGAGATIVLVAMVSALAGTIPTVMTKLAEGIVAFSKVIATAGPAFTEAIVTVLLALISAVERLTPKIQETLAKMLVKMLEIMILYAPKLSERGARLIVAILDGIAKKIGDIVTAATNVVVKFIEAIGKNQPKVIDAGVKMIINFINGVADSIRKNSKQMGEAGANLGTAIIEGMVRGIAGGIGQVTSAAKNAAKAALNAAKNFLGIDSPSKEFFDVGKFSDMGFAQGLDRYTHLAVHAAEKVGSESIKALGDSLSGMSDVISSDMDLQPTITPVLDLTGVKKEAEKISGMMATDKLKIGSSYYKAQSAAQGYESNRSNTSSDAPDDRGDAPMVQFNQYNSSPKALNDAEIYRQTNNQLSKAKGVVTP
jgi:tape measure domain-containing protein